MSLLAELDSLAGCDAARLQALFADAEAPAVAEFNGVADGRVLYLPGLDVRSPLAWLREPLLLWRGKVFEQAAHGRVRGLNRVGIGPAELRRYVFEAYPGDSEFDGQPVLVIDHDFPGNPRRFRRMHDEVRRLRHGLYLASSHLRLRDGLHFVCYFAFCLPVDAG